MSSKFYVLFISITLFTIACKSESKTQNETTNLSATNVSVEKVAVTPIKNEIVLSGNVEGLTTVRLGFLVPGKINFISAKEGQNVRKGQLLASLEPTNYNIGKELADVSVNSTTDEFNRLKLMHDRNSLSDGDFSKINYGLQQAKLQQKLQAKNLSDTKLYSTISGVLLKKMTEVGEIIGVGTPLFVISDISRVKVIAYVPEGELHNIKLGQNANVFISSLENNFVGKVIEVGSAADVSTRAFTLKIELANPKSLIRPGMIAEAKINSMQTKQGITLPAEAILHNIENQSYVFVADLKQKKAFKRNVSIGSFIDNKIVITSGLSPDENVIVSGQTKLIDGTPIHINN